MESVGDGLFLVGLDVADGVTDSLDALCVGIGNCEIECFLKLHDELYGVESIGAEVLVEFCLGSYFVLIYCEFVNDDLFYFLFDVRHV